MGPICSKTPGKRRVVSVSLTWVPVLEMFEVVMPGHGAKGRVLIVLTFLMMFAAVPLAETPLRLPLGQRQLFLDEVVYVKFCKKGRADVRSTWGCC